MYSLLLSVSSFKNYCWGGGGGGVPQPGPPPSLILQKCVHHTYKIRFSHGKATVRGFKPFIEMILINNFDCSHKKSFPFCLPPQTKIQFLWFAEFRNWTPKMIQIDGWGKVSVEHRLLKQWDSTRPLDFSVLNFVWKLVNHEWAQTWRHKIRKLTKSANSFI